MVGALWTEFTKNGREIMKNKQLPVLKELLRRGDITDEQYSALIKELKNFHTTDFRISLAVCQPSHQKTLSSLSLSYPLVTFLCDFSHYAHK